jgi:hypothetical protein
MKNKEFQITNKKMVCVLVISAVLLSGCTQSPQASVPPDQSSNTAVSLANAEPNKSAGEVTFRQVWDKLTYGMEVNDKGETVPKSGVGDVSDEILQKAEKHIKITPTSTRIWLDDDHILFIDDRGAEKGVFSVDENDCGVPNVYDVKNDSVVKVPVEIDDKNFADCYGVLRSGSGYAVLKGRYAPKGTKINRGNGVNSGDSVVYYLVDLTNGNICDCFYSEVS